MTKIKTMVPIIKSGLFEFDQLTISAAIMTRLMITSLDVKIMLAFIWASSLLLDFCSRYRHIPLATKAKAETTIIVVKSGNDSTQKSVLKLQQIQ